MPHLIWSPYALQDVQRIYRYDGNMAMIVAIRHQKEAGYC